LHAFGIIKEVPKNLTKKTYLKIEEKMIEFSKKVGIPVVDLDLLLWAKEAGYVFK
jgi:N-glycosylase/DNA lyase